MTALKKAIVRVVLIADADRRGTLEAFAVTVAPEGIYFRRPRQRRNGARLMQRITRIPFCR